MTSASLKEKPVRDLARLAKQHGVQGWHSMRKDQLIRALVRKAKSALSDTGTGNAPRPAPKAAALQAGSAARVTSPEVAQRIAEARQRLAKAKDLTGACRAGRPLGTWHPRDRGARRREELVHRHPRTAPLPRGDRLPYRHPPLPRPGPQQHGADAPSVAVRHARCPLGRDRGRLRPNLRHERWILSGEQQHGAAGAVRGTPAPADGAAGQPFGPRGRR
ncbi:MAG: hypothetical protein EBR23_06030 [Planctomycetia bacterium]|nr:hypothetical protein [Planctomycetia bacterium]